MLGTYVLSAGYYDAYYLKAQQVRTLIRRDYEQAFARVDVVAMPTSPTPAFRLGEKTDDPLQMYLADVFTVSANLRGCRRSACRAGFRGGRLPIGLAVDRQGLRRIHAAQNRRRLRARNRLVDESRRLLGRTVLAETAEHGPDQKRHHESGRSGVMIATRAAIAATIASRAAHQQDRQQHDLKASFRIVPPIQNGRESSPKTMRKGSMIVHRTARDDSGRRP